MTAVVSGNNCMGVDNLALPLEFTAGVVACKDLSL